MSDAVIPDCQKTRLVTPVLQIRITLMMRIRILPFTLMWIRILLWHFEADPDPGPNFHFEADPDPSFKIKAQNLERSVQVGSYSIHFGLPSAN